MTDQELISKANELLENKLYTRNGLAVALKISRYKLHKLSADIPKYPRLLTCSQAATHGVKTGRIKWGSNFRLPGSPNGR
jgi:hypothetical protein